MHTCQTGPTDIAPLAQDHPTGAMSGQGSTFLRPAIILPSFLHPLFVGATTPKLYKKRQVVSLPIKVIFTGDFTR